MGRGQLTPKQNKTTKTNKKKKNKRGAKSVEEVKDTKCNELKNNTVDVNSAGKKLESTASSQLNSVQLKESKTTENSKKEKSKNRTKTVQAENGTILNKVENNVASVEKKQRLAAKVYTADAGTQVDSLSSEATKTKIELEQSNTETKSANLLNDLSGQQDLDLNIPKTSESLPVVESLGNDEVHTLDYCPEAVLIAAEEDLHGGSQSEGIAVSDLADMDKESVVDHGLQSKTEAHSENEPEQHSEVSGPGKFKEGTPGGRLFKEETLAEIDAYLYLEKVSFSMRNQIKQKG